MKDYINFMVMVTEYLGELAMVSFILGQDLSWIPSSLLFNDSDVNRIKFLVRWIAMVNFVSVDLIDKRSGMI